MHISIPIENTMEYIQGTEISPLISKGYCKVCYVGQSPNRNHTVITKELATEMGRKLPGSPIVGYFNEQTEDFEGHERQLVVKGGKYQIVDITKAYGFVPTDADVWFQKFDDEGVEHEYLVTDAYIWTGVYPESQRILSQGNNQSMELINDSGFWTNDNKTNARIFIYNEAIIQKLCILGENVEPCFEGAQIASAFSLEDSPEFQEFKATMYQKLSELEETFSKGGNSPVNNEELEVAEATATYEELEVTDTYEASSKEEEEKEDTSKESVEEEDSEASKEDEEDKKKYNLDEIEEYVTLKAQYEKLQSDYNLLQEQNTSLNESVQELQQFKLTAERKDKKQMIDSFYMLSDADKQDVLTNIDTYSLDEIESKLSVICVRNKVNFSVEPEKTQESPQGLFNLQAVEDNDGAPDWIKAIRETAKAQ